MRTFKWLAASRFRDSSLASQTSIFRPGWASSAFDGEEVEDLSKRAVEQLLCHLRHWPQGQDLWDFRIQARVEAFPAKLRWITAWDGLYSRHLTRDGTSQ